MDCNKANKLMMDYMDLTITEEDEFLLKNHLKNCDECRESFELYTQILEEFTIDANNIIKAPEDLEINIMEKIENIQPRYIKEKVNKNIIAYVSLGMTSLFISIFILISLNKDILLISSEKMPILYKYYLFVQNIFNISIDTISISSIMEGISSIFPYILEGIKYTSIFAVVCIIVAQYLLHRRESLKV